jgi:osmotically-inducible protein OsmY
MSRYDEDWRGDRRPRQGRGEDDDRGRGALDRRRTGYGGEFYRDGEGSGRGDRSGGLSPDYGRGDPAARERGTDWRGGQGYGEYGRGSGDYGPSRYPDEDRWRPGGDARFWREGRPVDYGARGGSSGGQDRYSGDRSWRESGRGSWDQGNDRGFWDRATDEVSSWFGDEDAERRRRMDEASEGRHRGRGPKGYTRSDERIREDVSDRLTDDPLVDASDIEIAVSGGEVTLTGMVDSRESRRRAEDCAERISGVTHVQNNIRVRRAEDRQELRSDNTGLSSGTASGGTTAVEANRSTPVTRARGRA